MNHLAGQLRDVISAKYHKWLATGTVVGRDDFQVSVTAPAGSSAGHLVIFTDQGSVWIRLSDKFTCYPVDDFDEMCRIVDSLLMDEVRFAVATRNDEWVETTLVSKEQGLRPEPGVTYRLVSWTGKKDSMIVGA